MRGAFSSKRCFLFDLDGTLVDSSMAHARAFVETLQPGHPDLAQSFNYPLYAGRPTRDVFLALGLRAEPELSELTLRKQQLYRDAIERGDIIVFAGVRSLLAQLHQNGRRLFLVTGASRASTERILEVAKLTKVFEGIIAAEDISGGKPSPEPYLHALTTFGLEKSDCLAIEDAESGIRSAQAAGLEAVLIHNDLEIPGVTNVGNCENFAALLFA
jgi:HAD superfamily hydrolase (TIGR01509 family)